MFESIGHRPLQGRCPKAENHDISRISRILTFRENVVDGENDILVSNSLHFE